MRHGHTALTGFITFLLVLILGAGLVCLLAYASSVATNTPVVWPWEMLR